MKRGKIVEKFLDLWEDEYLGFIAKRRMKKKDKKYISSKEMERLVGFRNRRTK